MPPDMSRILDLATEIATRLSLKVLDVRLVTQGKRRVIEATIHRVGNHISFSDCEQFSRALEELLDRQEPPLIEGGYLLEVQSPGAERKLAPGEFVLFQGAPVEVKARQRIDGLGDTFHGYLGCSSQHHVTILSPGPVPPEPKRRQGPPKACPPLRESLDLALPELISIRLRTGERRLNSTHDEIREVHRDQNR
jgi:ribosome maturation factor RimP